MRIYALESEQYPLDEAVRREAAGHGALETLPWPGNYHGLGPALTGREGGLVVMPAIWEDLLIVKALDQFPQNGPAFAAVAAGPSPQPGGLAAAFNAGLTAFIETPPGPGQAQQAIKRAAERWRRMEEQRTGEPRHAATPQTLGPAPTLQNHLLGRALLDLRQGRGPLADGAASALLVTTSASQGDQLRHVLADMGVDVVAAGGVTAAVEALAGADPSVIIADNLLPDGGALDLAAKIRNGLKRRMPYFIVWSSSPEKAGDLLAPGTNVNDVILKPPPEAGIESTLPAIVAGIYRALD